MHLRLNPPAVFTAVSLLLIVTTVVAISTTQSGFFLQATIDLNSADMRDMVNAILLEHQEEGKLSVKDFESHAAVTAQEQFALAFQAIKNTSGVKRIKVFNQEQTIVWSDRPELVGARLTHHPADLNLAFLGVARATFNAADTKYDPLEAMPPLPVIEFYLPFKLRDSRNNVTGVVAIYRSPDKFNVVIRSGRRLLWQVAGLGAAALFIALYTLFHIVYFRQRTAEARFERLERVMQLEKLSSLGQMVSEIAHQLNNPLVGVVNLAELAEREVDHPERVKELLQEVRAAGHHCRDFVQRMLLLSKVTRSEPQSTDMNELAQQTVTFFRQSLGGRTPITLNVPDLPIAIHVDPVLIRHALFNLIHNAAQANPDGPLIISLANAERNGTRGCELVVADSGPGIAPEAWAKLFTPFYTTRPGGTGLGLSVAQQAVVGQGGTILGENRPEGGARFVIWLPAKANETKNPTR